MFFKIVILKTFTNFTAKHLRWLLLKLNILMHQLPIQLDIRIGSVNWNESYQKETKHIHAPAVDLSTYYILE